MFIDFADQSHAIPDHTDVCIVGAGVMGLAIASHLLAHSQRRVLLVEEGGLEDTESSSAVPAERHGGDVASAVAGSRAMGFGGSSRRWGGQALPFSPLDLADRPFLGERGGWPISWEELNRFYPAVDRFLGLTPLPFDTDLWRNRQVTTPFAGGQELELRLSKYSPHAYLAAVHQQSIARSQQASCLLHAKVASLGLDTSGTRAQSLRIRNRHGREATISAGVVVLSAGGIDNPRILLASRRESGEAIGNHNDLVGRYYQDHVGFFAAQLEPLNWKLFHQLFASFVPGNQKYLPKLQLSQDLQRQMQLLNVTGNLDINEAEDSPRNRARRLYHALRPKGPNSTSLRSNLRDLTHLMASTPDTLALLSSHLLQRRIAIPRGARYFLMANAESEPLYASRIILTEHKDAHGLDQPQVNWLLSELTLKALKRYGEALKNTLEPAGIASVKLSPYLIDPAGNWKERAYSLYHHMGATRMSATSEKGVVDPFGRVHGLGNLYLAGTSVLPTGSSSNPSYTALALAFRTAHQILLEG
jgi:choline dehydrogenase-like flavoprotein